MRRKGGSASGGVRERRAPDGPVTPHPSPVPLLLLSHPPAAGAWNMAVDEALMEWARRGLVTLRFYAWDPPCLSLGRNQVALGCYDPRTLRARGVDLVRRPTGGRAVYHDRELTYAVTAPAGLWGGLRESYRRINAALERGLRCLGVPVGPAPSREGRAPGPSARACFRDPLPGEIVVGGRKLVGSAQWREGGALLQHGSILLEDRQELAETLRRPGALPADGGDRDGRPPAVGLAELPGGVPSRRRLEAALLLGFREEFHLAPVEKGAEGTEALARSLLPRYRSDGWTWRR